MEDNKKEPIKMPPRFEKSEQDWIGWFRKETEDDEDNLVTGLIFKRFNDIVNMIKQRRLKAALELRIIKLDRLREKSDIRKMDEKSMPQYMRGQKRVVENDIQVLKEKNKFLIEKLSGEIIEEEEVPEEPYVDDESEEVAEDDEDIPTEEKLVIH